jgi:tRNA (guanine10-N2)-methyltransferase
MDNSLVDKHLESGVVADTFDAIVTDPPYGIRAGARRTGRKGVALAVSAELREQYFPATQQYAMEEVMLDLLHSAAVLLRLGGRLSYLLPTPYDFNAEQDLPTHPCLQLEAHCCQGLSTRHGRHLVVMRKVSFLDAARAADFAAYKQRVVSGADQGFGRLMTKLQNALSSDGLADESVVKRISQRCARRQASKQKKADASS